MLTAAAAGLIVGVGTGQGIYHRVARARADGGSRRRPDAAPRRRRRAGGRDRRRDPQRRGSRARAARRRRAPAARRADAQSDAGRVPADVDGPARGHLSQGPRSQGRRRRRAVGRLRQQPRRGHQGRRLPPCRRPPDRPPRARVRLLLRRRSRRRLRLPGAAAVRRSAGLPDRRDHPQPGRERQAARGGDPLPLRSRGIDRRGSGPGTW